MTFPTKLEDTQSRTFHEKPLRTRMLGGAASIAFMSLFSMFGRFSNTTLSVGTRCIVLVLASLGGAVGGAVYYASDPWRARGGIFKTAANVGSILAYGVAALLFIGVWVMLSAE
jgi:hypothetical protein